MPQLPDYIMAQVPLIFKSLEIGRYAGAAGVVVMFYDWILTLPVEIAHIWTADHWTVPSVLFVVVCSRYNL